MSDLIDFITREFYRLGLYTIEGFTLQGYIVIAAIPILVALYKKSIDSIFEFYNLERSIDSAISDATSRLEKSISEASSELERGISDATSRLEDSISEASSELERGISDLTTKIEKSIDNLQIELESTMDGKNKILVAKDIFRT